MADLRYHQEVFRLLGREPRRSEQRAERLRELEQRCGVAFPASIVEWFSLEEAEELFHEHSGTGDTLSELEELGDPAVARQGYLALAVEGQGVVGWYARLDGSDDPPVYDNHDDWNEELSQVPWRPCTDSFSAFILHMIGVYEIDMGETLSLVAQAEPPDDAALEYLSRRFTAASHLLGPERRRYRFLSHQARITIVCTPAEGDGRWSGHWIISSPSRQALLEVARGLWPFAGLSGALAAKSKDPEAHAQEQAVVEQLRS